MSVPEVKNGWYNQFKRDRVVTEKYAFLVSYPQTVQSDVLESVFFRLYECEEGIYSVRESLTQSNLGYHPLVKLIIYALMGPLVSSGQFGIKRTWTRNLLKNFWFSGHFVFLDCKGVVDIEWI